MANRKQRAATANHTMELLERESYEINGSTVSLSKMLNSMRDDTTLYTPSSVNTLLDSLEPPKPVPTNIEVINCTTWAAAQMLYSEGFYSPLCLNFASAKNPGGGFLSGSQAQEECLARSSGLHQSLNMKMEYYNKNRACSSSLYTNHLIYSPSVPVFRDDNDHLIIDPYPVAVITSPAVNAGAVRKNEPENRALIDSTMQHRIRSVLAVARDYGHDSIVLGAWGCGVFRNDPADIAQWFYDAIQSDKQFNGAFKRVIFAVLDSSSGVPTYKAFKHVFAN